MKFIKIALPLAITLLISVFFLPEFHEKKEEAKTAKT
jgi:hypothetical protein